MLLIVQMCRRKASDFKVFPVMMRLKTMDSSGAAGENKPQSGLEELCICSFVASILRMTTSGEEHCRRLWVTVLQLIYFVCYIMYGIRLYFVLHPSSPPSVAVNIKALC